MSKLSKTILTALTMTLLMSSNVAAKKTKSAKKPARKPVAQKQVKRQAAKKYNVQTNTKTKTKTKKPSKGYDLDLDDAMIAVFVSQNLSLNCFVSGHYCFLDSLVIEENDEFFESDYEEAMSDAKELTANCLETGHHSLNSIANCLNNDLHPDYQLTGHDICHNSDHDTLRDELREGPNEGLLNNCR